MCLVLRWSIITIGNTIIVIKLIIIIILTVRLSVSIWIIRTSSDLLWLRKQLVMTLILVIITVVVIILIIAIIGCVIGAIAIITIIVIWRISGIKIVRWTIIDTIGEIVMLFNVIQKQRHLFGTIFFGDFPQTFKNQRHVLGHEKLFFENHIS